jgi:uncharacterized protein involved in exopolysaccharide biosynthesis
LEFAQKEQIVATTDKASIAESNLAAANTALGNIIAERIKNEQLWKQVQSATAINLPQLLTNNVIDGLRARRNLLVTEFEEKSETFQPNYPSQVQITNKIKEVDHQLAAEVKTIQSSMKALYESSLSQEREMSKRIETLRADALDLQRQPFTPPPFDPVRGGGFGFRLSGDQGACGQARIGFYAFCASPKHPGPERYRAERPCVDVAQGT